MRRYIENASLDDVVGTLNRFLVESDNDPSVARLATQAVAGKSDQVGAVFDFVRDTFPYQHDNQIIPIGYPADTEYFQHPRRIAQDFFAGRVRSGDCVSEDTPIWVQTPFDTKLIEIRELGITDTYIAGIKILTREGYRDLLKVTPKGPREVVRILGTSDIGLTPNHKIVANPSLFEQGKYKLAKDYQPEDLIRVYPTGLPTSDHFPDNYELGWALGLFMAEGSAVIRKTRDSSSTWSIRMGNSGMLERAMQALSLQSTEIKFYIKWFPSEDIGVSTNYGPRKERIHHLLAKSRENHHDGSRTRFILDFRSMFYNPFKVKQVPSRVLFGGKNLANGFLDGTIAGDGYNGGWLTSATKLETFGIAHLMRKVGRKPKVTSDGNCATIDYNFSGKENRLSAPAVILNVYDLTTESGEFVAGDIAVKNCDDKATLAAAMLRNLGYEAKVLLVSTNPQGEIDHVVTQVETPDGHVVIDTTDTYPLGWHREYTRQVNV